MPSHFQTDFWLLFFILNGTSCNACFMFIKLVTITGGNSVFTKTQDSTATEFLNALVPGKKNHLKQGGQIVRLISFSYGKFWLLY